jgi:hypothetical protein
MTESSPKNQQRLSHEETRILLARAAEIDDGADSIPVDQLREIATEAGISAHAFDAALSEIGTRGLGVATEAEHRTRPPIWVRICMLGVPDRRAAAVYYWLFLAGLVAFPVRAFLSDDFGTASMLAGIAFCTFALWTTSHAIRWLDVHGWKLLRGHDTQ